MATQQSTNENNLDLSGMSYVSQTSVGLQGNDLNAVASVFNNALGALASGNAQQSQQSALSANVEAMKTNAMQNLGKYGIMGLFALGVLFLIYKIKK